MAKITQEILEKSSFRGKRIVTTAKAQDGKRGAEVFSQLIGSKCVEALLTKGADVRARDKDGWTPLYYVVSYPYFRPEHRRLNFQNGEPFADIVDRVQLRSLALILAAKPDVNALTSNGETALHWASFRGRTGMVRLLLEAGADREIRAESDGRTALQMAKDEGHLEVVRILESR